MQVVFLAAALDSNWLLPGHRQGKAMSQVGGMLLVNNCCDMLLKRYHRLYCSGWATALGYTGLATGRLKSDDRSKVRQVDASGYVGKRHQFAGYICSPGLVARMRPYLLFETASPKPPAPQTADSPRKTEVASQ
jgi:hypothetical protein